MMGICVTFVTSVAAEGRWMSCGTCDRDNSRRAAIVDQYPARFRPKAGGLINDDRAESLPDHPFCTACHLVDDVGGAYQALDRGAS
jgi:hypothetical protein